MIVVNSLSYQKNKWNNRPHKVIHQSINSKHLIIFTFCQNNHWYTFIFIRLEAKKFMLIQLDSLKSEVRIGESQDIISWFKSSSDVIKHNLTVSNFYLPKNANQLDTHNCGYFVCLHTSNLSALSTTYLSKVKWTVNFNELMNNSLSSKHTVQFFRNELHNFCTMRVLKVKN